MTALIDELIGWKRLLINGIEVAFRNRLNIIGDGVTYTDDPITETTTLTITPGSNVVAEGEWTFTGADEWTVVTCAEFERGDVVIFAYKEGEDSAPQGIQVRWYGTGGGSFQVCPSHGSGDSSTYTYKVLR